MGVARVSSGQRELRSVGGCDQAAARTERQQYPRIMAIDAARSRRMTSIQRNETDASSPRNLARRLLAHEALAATTSPQTKSATVCIYEKLRQQLSVTVRAHGFQVLASRALKLSKSEYSKLSPVQLTADGTLNGLDKVEWQTDEDQNDEVGVVLIAQLLGLFLIFLGEPLRLTESLDLQLEVRPESDATDSAAAGAPEDLLREADRLRSGSDRIQAMVHKHPGIGDRLVGVAGAIRKLATKRKIKRKSTEAGYDLQTTYFFSSLLVRQRSKNPTKLPFGSLILTMRMPLIVIWRYCMVD